MKRLVRGDRQINLAINFVVSVYIEMSYISEGGQDSRQSR